MFFFKSEKLADPKKFVDAVLTLQVSHSVDSAKHSNPQAYRDIIDTFGGHITNKTKSIEERREAAVQFFLIIAVDLKNNMLANKDGRWTGLLEKQGTKFKVILPAKTSDQSDEEYKRKVDKVYEAIHNLMLSYILATSEKINVHSLNINLDKGSVMPGLERDKTRFKNALRTFKKKNKRMPDFNKMDIKNLEKDSKDLKEFALILNTSEKRAIEILSYFGTDVESSLSKEIGGSEDEKLTLQDTLKSNEPSPDKLVMDAELKKILIQTLMTMDNKGQREVIELYYHPYNENAPELTQSDIAAQTSYTPRQIRDWVSPTTMRKLLKTGPLEKAYKSSKIDMNILKIVLSVFNTTEDLIFEVVAECRN